MGRVRAAIRTVTDEQRVAASLPPLREHGMVPNRLERTFSRGIATTSRAISLGRTSRIPTPPALPNRAPEAPRGSDGRAPDSVRTSGANRQLGCSASSFGRNPRADARSIHARRSPFPGVEMSDPACPASRDDGGESGSPRSARLREQRAPEPCPSRGLDASAPIALCRSARRREDGLRSPHAPLRTMNLSVGALHARSSSSQG